MDEPPQILKRTSIFVACRERLSNDPIAEILCRTHKLRDLSPEDTTHILLLE
jgi:hypothetical protein